MKVAGLVDETCAGAVILYVAGCDTERLRWISDVTIFDANNIEFFGSVSSLKTSP
jgi:hypothetical protein